MAADTKRIAIVGGGASGFFAALRAAEVCRSHKIKADIQIFEAGTSFLKKVRISGGGRCNVTHHIFESRTFLQNYPRGQKELTSPFQQFQAEDTVKWFADRGIKLKYEADGRMFPVTDSSSTIINCFLQEAEKYKIQLQTKTSVKHLKKLADGTIQLAINTDQTYIADSVLVATGSSAIGYKLAKNLNHSITELAPSLFTFKIKDTILEDLAGTSFKNAALNLKIPDSKNFKQIGPLLITHWGLSGPALLKLSAWAAREMMHAKYQAKIIVNWLDYKNQQQAEEALGQLRVQNSNACIGNTRLEGLTKRFWAQLLVKCDIPAEKRWSELSKKHFNLLVKNVFACELEITGKSRFKEEFVECGGVNLKEINFKTMQSKLCPGLYFSGEIMDVDGITGGFNFQNAWTSGWIAGTHMAEN